MSNTNTENQFVNATRKKYRFQSNKGLLTVEDLWELNLAALDSIAVDLDEKIQKAGRKSFIERRSPSTTDDATKLDIVKFVIETKQTEADAAKVRAEKANQREFLKSLLEKKQIAQLENLTPEQIQAELAKLD